MSSLSAVAENQSSHSQPRPSWIGESMEILERQLVPQYGEQQRARLNRGLRQIAEFWREEDGDSGIFKDFVCANFAADQHTLDTMFNRYQGLLEQLQGHMHEINREFRQQQDLDLGPVLPFDEVFAGYDPSAHVLDDFFANKLAFIVLLNFPLTTLQERLSEGQHWTRREWAEARLAQRFSKRIPAEVNLAIAQAAAEADQYVVSYNIWMGHLVDEKAQRLFPENMRLLSHWNLRDQIKADYAAAQNGLSRQRIIQQVMERIVTQTIPKIVINNSKVDWNPYSNKVTAVSGSDDSRSMEKNSPEAGVRYAKLLKTFAAAKLADPYSPTAPTLISRRFDEDREIPEGQVTGMFEQVLTSPLVAQVAQIIGTNLNRPLEPFDIWYNGFRPKSKYTEAELDQIVAKKYPTPDSYQKDIPNLLQKLGFSSERAHYLAANIIVDPARGAGHAMGAGMRAEKAHLRTRVEKTGMNYKGFNIAAHEMGHNVEQTFSLKNVDYTLLEGVPNTAFTEAIAFVFQARDLELLGFAAPDARSRAMKALNDFWATYEICGVALVDIAVWHWMYDNPEAASRQLNDAVVQISRDVWNRYYAPVFQKRDVVLLGVYSHMIDSFLYLPDYPIGHMIAAQIEERIEEAGNVGVEVERMTTLGRLTPELWMQQATGKPVGPAALLHAAERALDQLH